MPLRVTERLVMYQKRAVLSFKRTWGKHVKSVLINEKHQLSSYKMIIYMIVGSGFRGFFCFFLFVFFICATKHYVSQLIFAFKSTMCKHVI